MELIRINNKKEIIKVPAEASVYLYTTTNNKILRQKSDLNTWRDCSNLFKKMNIQNNQELKLNKYLYNNVGDIINVFRYSKYYNKRGQLINTLKESKEVLDIGYI